MCPIALSPAQLRISPAPPTGKEKQHSTPAEPWPATNSTFSGVKEPPSLPCIHLEDADTKQYTVKGVARDYGGRNVNDVWIRADNTLITRTGDKKVYVARSATNVRNEIGP